MVHQWYGYLSSDHHFQKYQQHWVRMHNKVVEDSIASHEGWGAGGACILTELMVPILVGQWHRTVLSVWGTISSSFPCGAGASPILWVVLEYAWLSIPTTQTCVPYERLTRQYWDMESHQMWRV